MDAWPCGAVVHSPRTRLRARISGSWSCGAVVHLHSHFRASGEAILGTEQYFVLRCSTFAFSRLRRGDFRYTTILLKCNINISNNISNKISNKINNKINNNISNKNISNEINNKIDNKTLLNLGFPNIYQALSYFDDFQPQKDDYYDYYGIFLAAFYD